MSEDNLNMAQEIAPEIITEQPKQERLYTSQEVDSLVGAKKAQAAEKVRRELEDKHQRELAELSNRNQQPIDVDALVEQKLKAREEAYKKQQFDNHIASIAQSFNSKMANFVPLDESEDELGITQNPVEFPELIFLANEAEDTQEFLREVAKNPGKAERMMSNWHKDPDKARSLAKKFYSSIKNNKAALASTSSVPAPLSQLKPSTVGSTSGKMGLQDFKKASWLRG